MIAILESHDPVQVGYLEAMLREAGLHPFVFAGNAPYPGAFPSRLLVPVAEEELARKLIQDLENDAPQ